MPIAVLVLGVLSTIGSIVTDIPLMKQVIVIFLAVGPGLAIVRLADIRDRPTQIVVVVPFSAAILGLTSTALLYMGIWSAALTVVTVALLTNAALVAAVHDRAAQALLLTFALLPGIVFLAGGLRVASP